MKRIRNFLCFVLLLSAYSAIIASDKPTGLSDLDVTFISRTPRYERLRVSYHKRADGLTGDVNPYLSFEEVTKQRRPKDGELVTFTTHVKNHGDCPVNAFEYLWAIDGVVVQTGISEPLLPNDELQVKYQWQWQSGAHTVSFQADPQNAIQEISKRNNQLTDRTDALTFHFHVEQTLYDYFKTVKNSWGTYSWEDWAQSHVALMNEMFKRAVYPTTPEGITERVRLDKITIHPDGSLDPEGTHAPEDWEWDGRWGFKKDYLNSQFYEKNPWALKNEWSLIHELGHQVGRIDLYCIDVTAAQNEVNGEAYRSNSQWGMMHRGIYLPEEEVHFFCEHIAASFNRDRGVRRGHFGEYLLDIPKSNFLKIVDSLYKPLANTPINVYQAEPHGYTEKKIAPPPKFSGETDTEGLFSLGENPFGEINNWGTNGIFLIEIIKDNKKQYHWLEIVDFNLEYWRGNKDSAVYKILVK